MDKTILIGLSGQVARFRLDEDAYQLLAGYLERAGARLQDDPERSEVLDDLERSVGSKLATLLGSDDRVVTAADIDAVLEEIGTVDTGREPVADAGPTTRPPRRLRRIREGQQLAGVCNGLADYSELNVDWVRTFFVLGSLVTAGLLGLVYIAMAFILPVDATRDVRP